jgi:hypothetical protein
LFKISKKPFLSGDSLQDNFPTLFNCLTRDTKSRIVRQTKNFFGAIGFGKKNINILSDFEKVFFYS